jgi:hypothetical protein
MLAGRGFFPIGSPYTRRGRGRGINLPADGDRDGERGLLISTGTGMGISPRRGAAPLTSLIIRSDGQFIRICHRWGFHTWEQHQVQLPQLPRQLRAPIGGE